MKQLLFIFSLLPFCLFGQGKKSFATSRVYKDTRQTSPYIFAYPVTDARIDISWTKEVGTSSALEVSTNSKFNPKTTLYTGAATSYSHTGLTPDTRYYYRVRVDNSKYYTASCQTPPDALIFFDFSHTRLHQDDIWGKETSFRYDTIRSVTSNSKAIFTSGSSATEFAFFSPHNVYSNYNSVYTFSPTLTLAGDFTLFMRGYFDKNSGGIRLLEDAGGNQYLSLRTTDLVLSEGSGDVGTVNYPNGLKKDSVATIILQRQGTTLRLSFNWGATWTTNTAANIGGTLDFTKLVGSSSFERFVIDDTIWTQSQIDAVRDFTDGQQIPVRYAPIDTLSGVTYTNLSSDYFADPDYQLSAYMTHPWTNNVIGLTGGENIISHHSRYPSPEYMIDFIRAWKPGGSFGVLSNRTDVPPPNTTLQNLHNAGHAFKYADRIIHVEPSAHYDITETKLIYTVYGKNLNMSVNSLPPLQENAAFPLIRGQYFQEAVTNNVIYTAYQKFSYQGFARWICLAKTNNMGKTFTNYTICDTAPGGVGTGRWLYPQLIYSEDDTLRLLIKETAPDVDSTNNAVYFIWSADGGRTWKNTSGSFSKLIVGNPITLTELRTNCGVVLCHGGVTGEVNNNYCFLYPSTGMLYFITGDGTNTSLKLYRATIGGSWTSKTIQPGTRTLNVTTQQNGEHGSNNPFAVFRGGNTWDAYAQEITSVNQQNVVRYRSTDNGDNWTFMETLAGTSSKVTSRIAVTKNFHFSTNRILIAYRQEGGNSAGNHHLFIKDITN